MYFFIDTKDKSTTAFNKLSVAARFALDKLGKPCPAGTDPVATARSELGDRGALLNLSGAFESIVESDDRAAQELAADFKSAIDKLYEK